MNKKSPFDDIILLCFIKFIFNAIVFAAASYGLATGLVEGDNLKRLAK